MVVAENSHQVLIIIGAARSGTKFLRDTLAASDRVCAIPYDVNYIWRIGHESCAHDELPAEECDDALAARIRKQLMKAARIRGNSSQSMLVEKTVSNCLRVDFVNKVFPEARYIHIIRDGRAVVESACRQWIAKPDLQYLLRKVRTLPLTNMTYQLRYAAQLVRRIVNQRQVYSSWGPRYSGIDKDVRGMSLHEVCAIQWVRCVERASDVFSGLNSDRVLTTHYEDLTTGTGEMERICDFLGLTRPNSVIDYFCKTVRSDHVDKWQNYLDAAQQRAIMPLLSEQLQRSGYG